MFIQKVWKDRVSEYPTRRGLKKADGTVDIVTVSREEGSVSVEGDAFSAENMNDLEERVASGIRGVILSHYSYQYIKTFSLSCGVTVMILNGITPEHLINEHIYALADEFLPKYDVKTIGHAILKESTYYNVEINIPVETTQGATIKTRTIGTASSADISNSNDYKLYGIIMWDNCKA